MYKIYMSGIKRTKDLLYLFNYYTMLILNVLTFNVWGIPLISQDIDIRMKAIAEELNNGKYDLVSLQELWSREDCDFIRNKTINTLPYNHYFFSGVWGSGLMILSKFPILSCIFHQWCVNGYFTRIQHADWFGGKGIGLCRINMDNNLVHFYNTHLHAAYSRISDDYKAHRVVQAFDTAQFIVATRGNSIIQILAGDFNTKPNAIAYKVLLYTSHMIDGCKSQNIATSLNPNNTYTDAKEKQEYEEGLHIDHIFIRGSLNVNLSVICELPFPKRVPGYNISYSDHDALLGKLQLNIDETQPVCDVNIGNESNAVPVKNRISVINKAIFLCDEKLKELNIDSICYYIFAALTFLLLGFLIKFSEIQPDGSIYRMLLTLSRYFSFSCVIYCLYMGSIWNCLESNCILSIRVSLQTKLNGLNEIEDKD